MLEEDEPGTWEELQERIERGLTLDESETFLAESEKKPTVEKKAPVKKKYKWKDEDLVDPLGIVSVEALASALATLEKPENTGQLPIFFLESFDPGQYLATVHKNSTAEQLRRGMANIDDRIEAKAEDTKTLIMQNFQSFVDVKATVDTFVTDISRNEGTVNLLLTLQLAWRIAL